MTHTIFLSPREAALAAKGELKAIVRVIKQQPPEGYEFAGWVSDTTGNKREIGRALWLWKGNDIRQGFTARSPFGVPGDTIAGKETWVEALDFGYYTGEVLYKATYTNGGPFDDAKTWNSSAIMPHKHIRHFWTVGESRAILAIDIQTLTEKEIFHCNSSAEFWKIHHIDKPLTTWVWYATLENHRNTEKVK